MENEITFGELINKLRKDQKISSRELSRLVNKGSSYVSQIEKGRNKNPDFGTAWTILKILGVMEGKRDSLLNNYGIFRPEGEVSEVNYEEQIKKIRDVLNLPPADIIFMKSIKKEKKAELEEKIIEINKFLNVILDFNPSVGEQVINEIEESLRNKADKTIVERVQEILTKTDDLSTTLSLGSQLENELTRRGLNSLISKKKGEE